MTKKKPRYEFAVSSPRLFQRRKRYIQSRLGNGTEIPIIAMGAWEGSMKLPHRRQFLHLAAGAAALPAVSRVARAQAYPTRPVRLIVGFTSGAHRHHMRA